MIFTDLRLGYHGVVPVAERRVLEPELRLAVSLLEELFDAPGRPLVVDVPALGGVRHVARVEQQAQDLGLVEAGTGKLVLEKPVLENGR